MKIKTVEAGAAELLVRFYDQNDEEALSEFFLRFKDLAFRIAFNVLNNSADAEDITQQTFVQLLKKQAICKAAYDGDDYKVKSWLLAVIYNASRMQYNSKKKNKTYELTEGANVESPNTIESETSSDKDGVISKLNKAIFDLPEKYRVPILMRYHQDMSIDDISKTLASQPGTIRSILSRGVSILRNKLSGENITLSSVAAIELIASIPYPMPKQEISLSLIKSIKATNPHVQKAFHANHSNSSFIMKTILAVSVSAAVIISYFTFTNKAAVPNVEKSTSISTRIKPEEKLSLPKSNWKFSKENGADIVTMQGKMLYDSEKGIIINDVDTKPKSISALLKIPYVINSPVKITVKSKVLPKRGNYEHPLFNSLEYIPILNSKPMPGGKLYHFNYLFPNIPNDMNDSATFDHIFYVFDNVSIVTTTNHQILKVFRYEAPNQNANIGLIVANFAIEEINIENLGDAELEDIQNKALAIVKSQENAVPNK